MFLGLLMKHERMQMRIMRMAVSKIPCFNLNSLSSTFSSSSKLLPTFHTPTTPFIFTLIYSFSSLSKSPNPLLFNFLTHSLHFSNARALTLANHSKFTNLKSLDKPQSVLKYFDSLGFSPQQIQSSFCGCPQLLVSSVDNTLKPKIEYFQQLGFSALHLGKFISRNPTVLSLSLEKNLVPTVELSRKILVNDQENKDLFKVLSRAYWLLSSNTNSRILPNVRFLESCGIVGSQLAMLFKMQPRLFIKREADLRNLVSRVTSFGFNMNSKMFVHGVYSVSSYSVETFKKKVQIFERFGFSEDEYFEMFRKFPSVLGNSTNKSIIGLDFYLNTAKLRKEVIISNPVILKLSIESRVIPRYRVLQVIVSKKLLKKQPSFLQVLLMRDEVFLKRFISKFTDHEDELLKAYKCRIS